MKKTKQVTVKSNRDFENYLIYWEVHQRDLKIKVPRRLVPLAIHKSIRDFKGKIVWADGTPYLKPVCIYTEFDLENRWYSIYRKVDENGLPLHKSFRYNRLRLLDIWHQIRDIEGIDEE